MRDADEESLRAELLGEFEQELNDLDASLAELVDEAISEWLDGSAIDFVEAIEPGETIDPDQARNVAVRVLAIGAAAELLDRAMDPEDGFEVDLRDELFEMRSNALLDMFLLMALSAAAEEPPPNRAERRRNRKTGR